MCVSFGAFRYNMNYTSIQAIPLPTMIISDGDDIIAANDPACAYFPKMRIGSKLWATLRHPNVQHLLEQARQGKAPVPCELRLNTPTETFLQATAAECGAGNIMLCLQDINETSAAVQMRKDFIADLSHELRSPLTAIQAILETAMNDADALAHFLPVLQEQVTRMDGLAKELLTLSRIENNERRKPDSLVNLNELLCDTCSALEIKARASDVEIDLHLPEQTLDLHADKSEITRALTNLIENALRYAASGKRIEVRAFTPPQSDFASQGFVIIDVIDFGPGVAEHHLPRLTERFYRITPDRARADGGHGLGLAIVKHIATHHRGQLTLSNMPKGGFKASLKLALQAKAAT